MVGLNVRKWGFYDKTVKNFKPFCWWDAFRSVWMTQQNAPIMFCLKFSVKMSGNVRRSHKLVQASADRYGYGRYGCTMRKTQ
jgi:hypothetical protein